MSGKLPPRKIAPRSGSGFDLGLALELQLGDGGGGQFSSGAILVEPAKPYQYILDQKAKLITFFI